MDTAPTQETTDPATAEAAGRPKVKKDRGGDKVEYDRLVQRAYSLGVLPSHLDRIVIDACAARAQRGSAGRRGQEEAMWESQELRYKGVAAQLRYLVNNEGIEAAKTAVQNVARELNLKPAPRPQRQGR